MAYFKRAEFWHRTVSFLHGTCIWYQSRCAASFIFATLDAADISKVCQS